MLRLRSIFWFSKTWSACFPASPRPAGMMFGGFWKSSLFIKMSAIPIKIAACTQMLSSSEPPPIFRQS